MPTTESLGHKAAKGAIWASVDRFGAMGIQFLVNLILARLLMPDDFGIIGMLAIFIAVSQTLIDGGFTSALIQKKEPSQTDFSTIFIWNTALSTLLYLILFFSAPLIADFYRTPLMTPVLRVVGLSLITNAVNAILLTRLRKALNFKLIAAGNVLAYTLSGCLAITLAYAGWGVWSLVVMQIFVSLFASAIFFFATRWLPSLRFSRQSFKELFNFGGYILGANVLQTACQNLQGPIIGRLFSATQMGYFSQAYKLDQVTSYSLPQVIVQVMYPVYSSIQDDKQRLQSMLLMNIRVISLIIFPILGLLMISSAPLIQLLYGAKWLPAAPYFSIFCVGGLVACLQNINFYAVAAVGRSRQLFLWSFYKWGFLIAALFIGAAFDMYGLLWAMVASNINIYLVNAALASRHVGLSLIRQFAALCPVTALLILSIAGPCLLNHIIETGAIIRAIVFIIIYISGSLLFNRLSISELFQLIHRLRNR